MNLSSFYLRRCLYTFTTWATSLACACAHSYESRPLPVACTAEGECVFPVTLSMLGIAAEIICLWVPFPLLPSASWLIGSCGGTSSSPLYGSNVGEGVDGLE